MQNNQLPLDFFSFHWYGSPNPSHFDMIRNESGRGFGTPDFIKFATMDYDLSEYNYSNSFDSNTDVIRYQTAANLLNSFDEFLKKGWLTKVDWA